MESTLLYIRMNTQIAKVLLTKLRKVKMRKRIYCASLMFLSFASNIAVADEDSRKFIELPETMQQHMMSNMRDHLVVINEILSDMAKGELDRAAEIAESRLGMSSLESHGASHMSGFMPEGMQQAGTDMHKAASRFALKAQEGEAMPAYSALSEVTATCVACHSGYRIR